MRQKVANTWESIPQRDPERGCIAWSAEVMLTKMSIRVDRESFQKQHQSGSFSDLIGQLRSVVPVSFTITVKSYSKQSGGIQFAHIIEACRHGRHVLLSVFRACEVESKKALFHSALVVAVTDNGIFVHMGANELPMELSKQTLIDLHTEGGDILVVSPKP